MNKKIFIATLGCKVNQYDSHALKRKLISVGFEYDKNNPDLVIVNTCAVTKNAIRKDKRTLKNLRKKHHLSKIVLMGCFPETYKKDTTDIEADLIWGTGCLDELVEKIKKMMDVRTYVSTSMKAPLEGERSRYFIKIQDGCEQFCSYCNIPYARGKLQSRDKHEIINEVIAASNAGFGEIVLCGIHLGLYGKEKNSNEENLVSVIEDMSKLEVLGRIRLSSIEINDINENLLKLMGQSEKICNHLHLPLQSGSNKILKRMNRPYDNKYFAKKVMYAKKLIPDIAITTDVIVGFPGETKKDFSETAEIVRKLGISRVHVFPFSPHEKTPAYHMKPRIEKEEVKRRAREMREIGRELKKQFKEKQIDDNSAIAVEKIQGDFAYGLTEHYQKIKKRYNKKNKPKVGSLY